MQKKLKQDFASGRRVPGVPTF